jgi:hypothetical protein
MNTPPASTPNDAIPAHPANGTIDPALIMNGAVTAPAIAGHPTDEGSQAPVNAVPPSTAIPDPTNAVSPSTATPDPTNSTATGGAATTGEQGDTAAAVVGGGGSVYPSLVFSPAALASQWLPDTLAGLSRCDLGIHYRSLLETLIRVEELFGFEKMLRKGVAKEL